jgi:hypothetical protein
MAPHSTTDAKGMNPQIVGVPREYFVCFPARAPFRLTIISRTRKLWYGRPRANSHCTAREFA